jgi:magnesium chelatase family protein
MAMAMAIVCLDRSLRLDGYAFIGELALDGYAFIGELALDGSVRSVTGVLPMARCLRAAGVRRLAVAEENAAEAALVDSLEVVGVSSLQRCVRHLDGSDPLPAASPGGWDALASARGGGSSPLSGAATAIHIATVRGRAQGGHGRVPNT